MLEPRRIADCARCGSRIVCTFGTGAVLCGDCADMLEACDRCGAVGHGNATCPYCRSHWPGGDPVTCASGPPVDDGPADNWGGW